MTNGEDGTGARKEVLLEVASQEQVKQGSKINPVPEEKKRLALSSFSPMTLKIDVTADVLAPWRKVFQH